MALPIRPKRPLNLNSSLTICYRCQQIRNATLLRRPKRPYTFTQLVTLSDGSSYLHRTTSPAPVYRATKDIRNSPLWNPSSLKLLNVEEDEAGKLRAFRAKFGRGWDAEASEYKDDDGEGGGRNGDERPDESLLDLISGYGQLDSGKGNAKPAKEPTKSGKVKGEEK